MRTYDSLGKTTLMSTIIGRLLRDNHTEAGKCCVAYFYFKGQQQGQEGKSSHNLMLRAIVSQLLKRDTATSDHLFNKISNLDEVNLRLTSSLQELVETALETYSDVYVVLDGLDECSPGEAKLSVNWLLFLIKDKLRKSSTSIRLLLCGQRDGILDQLLVNEPSIAMENTSHGDDIQRYCDLLGEQIRKKFEISLETKQSITSQVAHEAKGHL